MRCRKLDIFKILGIFANSLGILEFIGNFGGIFEDFFGDFLGILWEFLDDKFKLDLTASIFSICRM